MICARCAEAGLASRVQDVGGSRTLMAMRDGPVFLDEQGVRHVHDGNRISAGYRCSNGHVWQCRFRQRCPAPGCSWGAEAPELVWF